MSADVSKAVIELTVHIIYGVFALQHNQTSVIVCGSVVLAVVVLSIALIAFISCRSRQSHRLSLQENIGLNTNVSRTYVNYDSVDFDAKARRRMSNYSVDTELEFSYYDPIKQGSQPNLATMKQLQTR